MHWIPVCFFCNLLLLIQVVRGNVLDASNIVLDRFHQNGKAIVVRENVKKGDILVSIPMRYC